MTTSAISTMQRAIINYINSAIASMGNGDSNKAFFGQVNGNRVVVGNRSFRYEATTDMYFGNGSRVACILPNTGNTAAIVGVR